MGWRETAAAPKVSGWRKTAGVAPLETEGIEAQPPPTKVQSAASGVVQGASLGFGDEIAAGLDTIPEAIKRGSHAIGLDPKPDAPIEGHYDQESANAAADKERGTLGDYYRQIRDNYRAENKTAQEANPGSFGAGKLAGNLAVPLPGTTAPSLAGKVAQGAGIGTGFGAVQGLGESEADLTKGDFAGAGKDAAKAAGFGAAGGALGGAVAHGLGKLGTAFGAKAAAADQKATDMVEAKALKLMNSALGSLGGETSAGRNAIEVMHEVISNPNSTAQQVAAAKSLLQDPAATQLVQRVYKNAINNFPGRLGKIQAAEKGVQEAADANTPSALSAAKEDLLANPIGRQVIPRVKRQIINRAVLPALGAAAGGATAGALGLEAVHGAELGAALGVGANSLIGGHAGTAWEKMMAHPSVQKPLNQALQATMAPAATTAAKLGTAIGAEAGGPDTMPVEDADGNPVRPLVIPRHPREGSPQGRPAVPLPRRATHPTTVDVQALPPTQMVATHDSTPEELAMDEEAKKKERMMRLARFFSGRSSDDDLDELQVQR